MNTTDANFKPTPGPWKRSDNTSETLSTDDAIYHRHSSGALKWVCRVYGEGCSSRNVQERDSNAALIAEAGTVYHETGKTPARLAEENRELLEALELALKELEHARRYFPKSIRNADKFSLENIVANALKPAIAKAKGTK